jgi:hypothetical protein
MSAYQTWFGRSIATPRSRYGKILCPGTGLLVRGQGPSAAIPILRISRCTRFRLTGCPCASSIVVIRREPRNGREQLVDPAHQRQIVVVIGGGGRRPIDARARNTHQLAWAADRQLAVISITSARRSGALIFQTSSLKSRSTMSWPILTRGFSISRSRSDASSPLPISNTRAA